MKKKMTLLLSLALVATCITGCRKQTSAPCRLFIYGTLSKVYQINFNGKDSIETICGTFDMIASKYYNSPKKYATVKDFHNKKIPWENIYMHKAEKLKPEQASHIISIVNRLNAKEITDTIKAEAKDAWSFYLSLEKQDIDLQIWQIKDKDIQMLVDSLREYSPLFINDYSRNWWGLESEKRMTRMYDHRKKKQK